MINKKKPDRSGIKNDIMVDNGIYEKIQLLLGNNTEELENGNIGVGNAKSNEVISRVRTFAETATDPLTWEINDRLQVVCEATTMRTNPHAKTNNIDSLLKHINQQHQTNYLVVSFRRNCISRSYKKCITFEKAEFNLETVCEISKLAKFWLETGDAKILLVEMKNGQEDQVLFILACLMRYCKMVWSAESAVTTLAMSNPLEFQFKHLETAIRYARYFDVLSTANPTAKFSQKLLNQVIITTIPTMVSSDLAFTPRLSLCSKLGVTTFSEKNCYIDQDYIIFSNLDVEIAQDIVLTLSFIQQNTSYHILDLCLNSLLYQQGLYRFTRNDILTSLPQERIYRFFDEKFCIDLVILENKKIQIVDPCITAYSILNATKSVSRRFLGIENGEILNNLKNLKYNFEVCKTSALLELTEEESQKLQMRYVEKLQGYQFPPRGKDMNNQKVTVPDEIKSIDKPGIRAEADYRAIYKATGHHEITEIKLIEQIQRENRPIKKPFRGLFANRSIPNTRVNQSLASIRPIHLAPLYGIENTIFNDMKSLDIKIDLSKFEKHFCEQPLAESKTTKVTQIHNELLEPKRRFIASLCLKHLEMKNIHIENLLDTLVKIPDKLAQQDLTNILKVIPTEAELLLLIGADEQQLTHVEKSMIKLFEIPEIKQIVSILVFENQFFEEIPKIEQSIQSYTEAVSLLLKSVEIEILFKVVLEVANLINYSYGKKKQAMEGFKVETLHFIHSYPGNDEYSLFDFMIEILSNNGLNFAELEKMIKRIDLIRNEEITVQREKINNLIAKYSECLQFLSEIEKYDKTSFLKLLGYACTTLKEVIASFKGLEEQVNLLKNRMGEEPNRPVTSLLETISIFCTKLLADYSKEKDTNLGMGL